MGYRGIMFPIQMAMGILWLFHGIPHFLTSGSGLEFKHINCGLKTQIASRCFNNSLLARGQVNALDTHKKKRIVHCSMHCNKNNPSNPSNLNLPSAVALIAQKIKTKTETNWSIFGTFTVNPGLKGPHGLTQRPPSCQKLPGYPHRCEPKVDVIQVGCLRPKQRPFTLIFSPTR